MTNVLKIVLGGLVFSFLLFVAFDYALSIPDVKMSYSSRMCVEVINYPSILFNDTSFSCENMPEKFNQVWIK
jgi:hypothetical protein